MQQYFRSQQSQFISCTCNARNAWKNTFSPCYALVLSVLARGLLSSLMRWATWCISPWKVVHLKEARQKTTMVKMRQKCGKDSPQGNLINAQLYIYLRIS